jgi:hypothetical protein
MPSPPWLSPRRQRDPARIAACKVGNGAFDELLAYDGRFKGADGQYHVIEPEEIMPALGNPITADPGQAILDEIARSNGHIKFLESKLIAMDEAELVMTTDTIEESRSGGPGGSYELKRREHRQAISPWWALYERERRHFASVCAAAVRAGVEERRIRIAERQQDVLEAAFIAAIGDLGLDPHDTRIRKVLGARLQQAIEGNSPPPPPVVVNAERDPMPVPTSAPGGPKPVDF